MWFWQKKTLNGVGKGTCICFCFYTDNDQECQKTGREWFTGKGVNLKKRRWGSTSKKKVKYAWVWLALPNQKGSLRFSFFWGPASERCFEFLLKLLLAKTSQGIF